MEENYWTRRRYSRRGVIKGFGLAAGVAALAPVIAACGGSNNTKSSAIATKASTAAATSATPGATKAAANGPKPVKGGTLTMRMASDVSTFDYAFEHDVYSAFILSHTVEPLLTHDLQAKPVPLLATSWETPDDHTYVFKLRPGLMFQDGTPLNADAVEYSMNRIHGDKTSFRYQDLIYIDKIEKPDQNTVSITLTNPYAPFLENLTQDGGRVVSPATAEKLGKDKLATDLTGLGTGPYKFVEWKTNDHVTLTRNENYWNKDASGTQLPYLDKLVARVIPDESVALNSLRTGEIDSFRPGEGPPPKDTESVKSDSSLNFKQIAGLGFNPIYFNETKDPFSSKPLRQAVSYAVDRDVLAKTVYFGTVLANDVIFSPATWADDPSYHPYLKRDVAKAKQLLAQAGKPNGFAFTYLIATGSPTGQQAAELLQSQLQEAGITMTIQQIDFPKQITSVTAGDYVAANIGWSPGYDPDQWVYNHFSTKGSLNARTHYNNPQVDKLLDDARTTLDVAKRTPLYQQAQKLIMDDAVFCILYSPSTFALASKKVQNYPIGPTPAVGISEVWKTA